jgi:hypothetical protein
MFLRRKSSVLQRTYGAIPCLHLLDFHIAGFDWPDTRDIFRMRHCQTGNGILKIDTTSVPVVVSAVCIPGSLGKTVIDVTSHSALRFAPAAVRAFQALPGENLTTRENKQ